MGRPEGYLTQCEGECGRTTRRQKPGPWTCDECVAKGRKKTVEMPIVTIPWSFGSGSKP